MIPPPRLTSAAIVVRFIAGAKRGNVLRSGIRHRNACNGGEWVRTRAAANDGHHAASASSAEHEDFGEEPFASRSCWRAVVGEEVGEEAPVRFTGAAPKGSWVSPSVAGGVSE